MTFPFKEYNLIHIGVIGCGQWGPNYIRIFSQLPQTACLGCADIDPEKLKLIHDLYPSLRVTADYREILKDKEIHAVCLATHQYTFRSNQRSLRA